MNRNGIIDVINGLVMLCDVTAHCKQVVASVQDNYLLIKSSFFNNFSVLGAVPIYHLNKGQVNKIFAKPIREIRRNLLFVYLWRMTVAVALTRFYDVSSLYYLMLISLFIIHMILDLTIAVLQRYQVFSAKSKRFIGLREEGWLSA